MGVEALRGKRERCQHALQDRQRRVLGNALVAAGELVLGDLVDGIDVIDDLDLVEVALMHQVEANPVRATLGHGLRRSPIGAGVERVESLAPSTRA